jgi:prepilin-type N-terminal cleavage/methylation domain-containing protein
MKKAFTLIELLVVIAIIAILAAILFPVFAQAKEAAKKTQSISNAKQMGTSIMIYTADYDDLFPTTNMTDYSSGDYTAGVVTDTPANWRSNNAAWVSANGSVFPNNTYPYSKNANILEAAGAPSESTWASATPAASRITAPWFNSLTMNGFLSSYSQTSVNEVSKIPMLWYGNGRQKVEGYTSANPILACAGSSLSGCTFNPGGNPTATSAYPGLGGVTFGTGIPNDVTAYVHSGGQIYVHTDTSTKFVKLANPNTENNLTYVDPYANYDASGIGSFFYSCAPLGSGAPGYSCIFRPDFDFNYDNWE